MIHNIYQQARPQTFLHKYQIIPYVKERTYFLNQQEVISDEIWLLCFTLHSFLRIEEITSNYTVKYMHCLVGQ
jgi:hypothetical protein